MCRDQAVTNALTGISTCTNCSVHGTGFTTDQYGYITATDKLAADQAHFGGLGHGIGCFDSGNQSAGFDHTQRNPIIFICHLSIS